MCMKKILVCSVLIVTLCLSCFMFTSCSKEEDDGDVTTIKMSVVWNGLSSMKPQDGSNNRTAKIVEEKTGVRLDIKWVNGTENEQLVRIFSTGKNMPDCIMAPYWGGGDACSDTIRKAAKDGLIIPLDDLIDSYAPNLKDAYTTGIAESFITNELGQEEFRGNKYIIPMHTPANFEEYQNWGYTVYCRKDILEALNVDAGSIHTSQDIYDLAKKIQSGNFKDINGNPIIPASCWANGYGAECYLNSFKTRQVTEVVDKGDHFEWSAFQDNVEEEVKFMQKMVSEGLFDKTAFSHNETTALSKHVTGGVGLTATQYPYLKKNLKDTLYKDHPEMEYVPLGPIYDANGNAYMPNTVYEEGGYYGFAVLMISKDCKPEKREALMKYLNFINSDEGKILAYLGEEGVDYTLDEDGQPHMTEEFFANEKSDSSYAYNQGIDTYFTFGVSRVPFNTFDAARQETTDLTYEAVKKMYPVTEVKGIRASSWDDDFPDIDYLHGILETVDYTMTMQSAYCAATQEEALKKLQDYRNAISSGGYLQNYLNWLYEKIGGRTDILF